VSARQVAQRVVRPVVGKKGWDALRRIAGPQSRLGLITAGGDLTALAKYFGTDKWGDHRYTPRYQAHFQHLRKRPVRLLEIGIGGYDRVGQGGASLRMWKHYFRNGQIFGLDIEDKSFVEEDRIRVFQGDQSDPDLLKRIVHEAGGLDIVIDDGSHRPEHVIATFETLFPLIDDHGIYVVEDTQTSYWPEWGGAEDPADPHTSMAMLKRLADGLNYEEFVVDDYRPSYTDLHVTGLHFYHNLVVVEKGRNAEGTRKRRILASRYATQTGDAPAR
jgi:cephalosporin hydroxylase